MAVKYVDDFEFPSGFGFHKSSIDSKSAKGMGSYAKSKAGPSVVTGNTRGTGGGKHTTGSVPKFADGGWAQKKGVNNDSGMGHMEAQKGASKAKGDGDVKRKVISDTKSPPGTRGEKSSGVQKPAFKSGGHATTPQRYAKGGHAADCGCKMCGGGMMKKAEGGPAKFKPSKVNPPERNDNQAPYKGAAKARDGREMEEKESAVSGYAGGGSIKVAAGKVKDGAKTPWNKDDGVSPGSFKRTPPGEKVRNEAAANSRFSAEGRNTNPATEQNGNVERMSEFSDFKKGGSVKATTPQRYKHGGASTPQRYAEGGGDVEPGADRYEVRDTNEHGGEHEPAGTTTSHGMKAGGSAHPHRNLGGYLHKKKGGDVKVPGTSGERASGTAAVTGTEVNHSAQGLAAKYEQSAGTPGSSEPRGDYYETTSGEPHMAMGGLSRGVSPKKNAAMHAKIDHKAMGALSGIVGALGQAPHQPAAPGMGPAPPGMAPQMGAPPGMSGGVRPQPPMAGGPRWPQRVDR
jgi:hypothetical protein